MAEPLGPSPIGERAEFLTDAWVAGAEARLRRSLRHHAGAVADLEFSFSEAFSNAPPHLKAPGDVAAFGFTLKNGELTVSRVHDPDAEFVLEGDYQAVLPIAQAVGPKALSRAMRELRHMWGRSIGHVEGDPPEGVLADIMDDMHDHMARRTLENPDLSHRLARMGLQRNAAELEEQGYTILESVITDGLNDELREACIEEALEHRAGVAANGRVDTNGLLARGRVFEEIVQHPRLRAVAESSLGPGMILHTVGGCMMQPGPGALGPHADYVAVPDPFPEFALMGVSIWALDDWTTPAAGPTWIIPGSHRHRRKPRPDDSLDGAVPILMPKGSVAFITQGVWHWQGERTLHTPRVSMHNAYSRGFVRQADDFSGLEAVFHRNSPVLSMLAGKDDYFGRTSYRGHDRERMDYMYRTLAGEQPRHPVMAVE